MEKKVKESKVSLVKIDSELYAEAKSIADASPIDFPSVKNFIETALRNYIRSIKYNIEGIDELVSKETGALKPSLKNTTLCDVCGKPFMKDKKDTTPIGRICQNCKHTILFFSKLLETHDKNFKRMKNNLTIDYE
mgnify:FL=1